MPDSLSEAVRAYCARVAAGPRWIRIDDDALAAVEPGGTAGLDPDLHFLDGAPEEIARYVLVLDATNFGSGWFAGLRTGTEALTRRLTEHARARGGTWTAAELRSLGSAELAAVLDLDAAHPLIELYAEGLRQLGEWLGDRGALDAIAAADGSAQQFAAQLAAGMPFFDDPGFYKRAQITANDLALAGVADFADADRLTAFADNLLPHVLRLDGALVYADALAAYVDAGRPLPAGGSMEIELRAAAVHACERLAERFGVPPRTLDNWLWNRGAHPPYSERPAHRTYTVFY
jgi:putative queuosine salvage protein